MIFKVPRYYENQLIRIPIKVWNEARIVIVVSHPKKQNTIYFRSAPILKGINEFKIRIPKIPMEVIVELYNEENGNTQHDSSYSIGDIKVEPIRQLFSVNKIIDGTVNSFARFSDNFAENAGILSAQNSVYVSPDGRFRIDYKDVIRADNGMPLKTPARINKMTGIIEISKRYYERYTVPGRKAINWHEFSHLWRNVNAADEIEADKNAIMIYLGMGNPTVEAYNVFLKVFKNTDTKLNRMRYYELKDFIENFNVKVKQYLNLQQAV